MSVASWSFKSDDSAERLVREIRRDTGVDRFDLAVVLGSGWGDITDLGEETLGTYAYSDWPCFPAGQIIGQSGRLIVVKYLAWNILFFSGRFHYYQNLSAFQAAFPIRLACALGVSRVLLTCAAGGINPNYKPGDFMLIDDHINLLGDNPLRGLEGDIFVDMAASYRQDLYDQVQMSTPDNIRLHRGVLAAMSGPSYETPAEINLLHKISVDVVSMSIVPETIMARFLSMQVAAVALIANQASGLAAAPVSHEDVLQCGHKNTSAMHALIRRVVDVWCELVANSSS